ncbi:hypothetical protein RB3140 [Rhodopirellula baltica SH 1]|uniref:Uncharacterized protein n=1 Tax=Rhodopirellula baltica (strain DSM 10527 / NCIMB 13988 / SH1) TaxID=243090 RepID=Q7UUQ9_RHOBA|nr:hypothetical protein RB3140 [Rhodopirellula baltica SH 1]
MPINREPNKRSLRTNSGADAQLRVPTSTFLPTIRDQPKDAMQGIHVRSGSAQSSSQPIRRNNDPHHGAAGVDVDFKTDWPPPLPCMRWFCQVWLGHDSPTTRAMASSVVES